LLFFQIINVDTSEDQSSGGVSRFLTVPGWTPLERCATLCNNAEFLPDQDNLPILKKMTNGDASESALLKCVELSIGDAIGFRRKHEKVTEVPFNSTNKYQVGLKLNNFASLSFNSYGHL
jgi:sodium/potassium-transporting ATPase subunit alpha